MAASICGRLGFSLLPTATAGILSRTLAGVLLVLGGGLVALGSRQEWLALNVPHGGTATLDVLGSRFGSGHGKDATTIAGAIGGAMVGDRIGTGNQPVQQQCNTVYEPGPPAGYQVTYDYQGRLLTTTTANPPGEFLRVRNRVTLE